MSTDDLLQQISILEKESIKLDPDSHTRESWFKKTGIHAENYLTLLRELPAREDIQETNAFSGQNMSETAIPIDEVLKLIYNEIERSGLKPASPGYLAYIPGGGLYPSALGDYLAATGNHYAGFHFASPGAVRMENQLIRWIAELIGYDPEIAGGNLTSGGSYAALIAMHTARETMNIRARDIEKAVIYASSQAHHTVFKALRVIGMREATIREIEMDDRFQIRTESLKNLIEEDLTKGLHPFMIIASAGTTDTGSVDPLEETGIIAKHFGMWYHVDAAYGGFFLLTPLLKKVLKGISLADSVVIDPHKGLFVPYGSGMIVVKDKKNLLNAHAADAAYLQDLLQSPDELSPADLSPELSRHFRGLRVWLPLKLFGLKPFRAALSEKRLLCLWLYEKIKDLPHFETGPYPDLSVFIFRCHPPKGDLNVFNQKLIKMIQNDGHTFLSSTKINGDFWIRVAILNFRTHLAEVQTCLEFLIECSSQLLSSHITKQENEL